MFARLAVQLFPMALKVHHSKRKEITMRIETMEDLFVEQLQDLYDAEERLVKALPKMAEAATSTDLRQAFSDHLKQTMGHVQRLEQVFSEMDKKAKGETCEAMKGLIEEGEEIVDNIDPSALRDAGLIAAANRVEHYEMAGYGTARAMAEALGLRQAASLLQQTLQEEKAADEKLTKLAETKVNKEAMGGKTRTAR
jgi:ferritin-like metal-binding protein YciE